MTDAHFLPPRTAVDPLPLLSETFGAGHVTQMRHVVASRAESAGLSGQRLDDFVLAVNELITNAVRHGGGWGRLHLWRQGGMLFCEVSDHGPGIDEALDYHRRPPLDAVGGWGLWLTRQLSDSMIVRTGSAGTTVQIGASIDPAQAPPPSAPPSDT